MSELQIWLAALAMGLVAMGVTAAFSLTAAAPFLVATTGLMIWARFKGPTHLSGVDITDAGDGGDGGDGGGN